MGDAENTAVPADDGEPVDSQQEGPVGIAPNDNVDDVREDGDTETLQEQDLENSNLEDTMLEG